MGFRRWLLAAVVFLSFCSTAHAAQRVQVELAIDARKHPIQLVQTTTVVLPTEAARDIVRAARDSEARRRAIALAVTRASVFESLDAPDDPLGDSDAIARVAAGRGRVYAWLRSEETLNDNADAQRIGLWNVRWEGTRVIARLVRSPDPKQELDVRVRLLGGTFSSLVPAPDAHPPTDEASDEVVASWDTAASERTREIRASGDVDWRVETASRDDFGLVRTLGFGAVIAALWIGMLLLGPRSLRTIAAAGCAFAAFNVLTELSFRLGNSVGLDPWRTVVQVGFGALLPALGYGVLLAAPLRLQGRSALRSAALPLGLVIAGVALAVGVVESFQAEWPGYLAAGLMASGTVYLAVAALTGLLVASRTIGQSAATAATICAAGLLVGQWYLASDASSARDRIFDATVVGVNLMAEVASIFGVLACVLIIQTLGRRATFEDGPLLPPSLGLRASLALIGAAFVAVADPTFVTVRAPVAFIGVFVALALVLFGWRTVYDSAAPGYYLAPNRRALLDRALRAERNRRARTQSISSFVGGEHDDGTFTESRTKLDRERRELGPQATVGLAIGPRAHWHANGVHALRVGGLLSVIPVVYFLVTLAVNEGVSLLTSQYGLAQFTSSLAAELAFWLVASYLLGVLLTRLPTRTGGSKGLLLALVIGVPSGLIAGWIGDGNDAGWPLRWLELMMFLAAVGILIDHQTLLRVQFPGRALLELYRAGELRWFLVYAASVVAAIAAFAQQLQSGAGIDSVTEIFQAAGGLAPPER